MNKNNIAGRASTHFQRIEYGFLPRLSAFNYRLRLSQIIFSDYRRKPDKVTWFCGNYYTVNFPA